jgi:hypothetical protein
VSVGRERLQAVRRRLTQRSSRRKSLHAWSITGFAMPAPPEVKWGVLARWELENSPWLETGTFYGDTTAVLAKRSPSVVTLEPMFELYEAASARLKHLSNVEVINASSETAFASTVTRLGDRVNFWLDGHYSSGNTFRGSSDTPIELELAVIGQLVQQDVHVAVFIDDVRLFVEEWSEDPTPTDHDGYPPLRTLVDWAEQNGLHWRIEHDIFIARTA